MDNIILGKRLRDARKQAHVTQEQAAQHLSIQRTAITDIEAGKRKVSSLEVTKLSELYDKSLNFFFSEKEEDDMLVTLHRAAPALKSDINFNKEINHYEVLCSECVSLSKLLGNFNKYELPIYSTSPIKSKWDAIEQGEKVAEEERKRLNIGFAPITDMVEFLLSQNIHVYSVNLPAQASGFFMHRKAIGLVIMVNSNHNPARKRFSYAHEYAHALLDRNHNVTISNQANSGDLLEIRANTFAAAFLMPKVGVDEFLESINKQSNSSREERYIYDPATEEEIKAEIRPSLMSRKITYQDVADLAYRFGVSYEAALYRLCNLKHLDKKELENLRNKEKAAKEYLKLFGKSEQSANANKENFGMYKQLIRLAIEAFRREEISRGKLFDLSKLVHVPLDKILSLVDSI